MPEDCFICAAATFNVIDLPWYDHAIHRIPGVGCTLLGVGAIAPGYLLACPEGHVASLALLPEPAKEPFARLVQRAARALARSFGDPLMFEHGACHREVPTSSCVSHAHLHLWSVSDSVRLRVPTVTHTYRDLRDFLRSYSAGDVGYLMHSTPEGRIVAGPDVGVPQFYRRQVADQLGNPYEWDYALFAFEHNMRATRTALSSESGQER